MTRPAVLDENHYTALICAMASGRTKQREISDFFEQRGDDRYVIGEGPNKHVSSLLSNKFKNLQPHGPLPCCTDDNRLDISKLVFVALDAAHTFCDDRHRPPKEYKEGMMQICRSSTVQAAMKNYLLEVLKHRGNNLDSMPTPRKLLECFVIGLAWGRIYRHDRALRRLGGLAAVSVPGAKNREEFHEKADISLENRRRLVEAMMWREYGQIPDGEMFEEAEVLCYNFLRKKLQPLLVAYAEGAAIRAIAEASRPSPSG